MKKVEMRRGTQIQQADDKSCVNQDERCVEEAPGPLGGRNLARKFKGKRMQAVSQVLSVGLLFLNFFLLQYDKFILSYFSAEITSDLNIGSAQYGLLSGYGTVMVLSLLALPLAYMADRLENRKWVLIGSCAWYSLCVIFQGLSHTFWQIILARIAMSIGQSVVEALSIAIISDLLPRKQSPLAMSVVYVGVYIGEAISAQISNAFRATNTSWRYALIAIGVVGEVVVLFMMLLLKSKSIQVASQSNHRLSMRESLKYVCSLKSFGIICIAGGFRELSGYVFGFYLPTYIQSSYPQTVNISSFYGIIVGVCGSISVVVGGLLTGIFDKTGNVPLFITAYGGIASSLFILLAILSPIISGEPTFYPNFALAYLTAELWLGSIAYLLTCLIPLRFKALGLASYQAVVAIIASTGPEIVGLSLQGSNLEIGEPDYRPTTRIILAVIVPAGYLITAALMLYLAYSGKVKSDLQRASKLDDPNLQDDEDFSIEQSRIRIVSFALGAASLVAIAVAFLVLSILVSGF